MVEKEKEELKKIQFSFSSLEPEDKLKSLIKAGMNNIWMVGPAGCGKSTIERISKLFNKEEQFQLLGGSVTILYGTINLRILDNLWKREPAQQK